MLRKSGLWFACAMLAVGASAQAQEFKPGHAAQWCFADVKVDGEVWKIYSANFANKNPATNAYMYDANKAYYYGEEWRKFIQAKYQIQDFFPSDCGGYALEWRDNDTRPYATEAAALAGAKKKRDEYRKYTMDGKPRYAGTIEMDWVPSATERMGVAAGEKRTPNPDLKKK